MRNAREGRRAHSRPSPSAAGPSVARCCWWARHLPRASSREWTPSGPDRPQSTRARANHARRNPDSPPRFGKCDSQRQDSRFRAGEAATDRFAYCHKPSVARSEEHTSELQSLMRISYAVFCLKKKKKKKKTHTLHSTNPKPKIQKKSLTQFSYYNKHIY